MNLKIGNGKKIEKVTPINVYKDLKMNDTLMFFL